MTEGFNNKIKVLKRNAYGFHVFDNFKKRILLNCEKHGNQAEA
jgi:transposase